MPIKTLIALFIITSSLLSHSTLSATKGNALMPFTLESKSFTQGGEIPTRFTCEGDNISPALTWSGVPQNTKSLVLMVTDPDAPDPAAPKMTWIHWLLYNIPPSITELSENFHPDKTIKEGKNDWHKTGYGGPCPPIGRHRYFFTLYALDIVLPDLKQPNKSTLEKAMAEHIIDQAELIGTYQKKSWF